MTTPKTSKRFLFVSLILCVALAASAVAAQAQVEPQQGAINTTKRAPAKQEGTQAFNPKEYLKEDSRIEDVKVELAARAGGSLERTSGPNQEQ